MPTIKLRVDRWVGDHVTVTFFGTDRDQCTLANHGALVMSPLEFEALRMALQEGGRRLDDVQVLVDRQVFLDEAERRGDLPRYEPDSPVFMPAEPED